MPARFTGETLAEGSETIKKTTGGITGVMPGKIIQEISEEFFL